MLINLMFTETKIYAILIMDMMLTEADTFSHTIYVYDTN